MDTFVCSSWYLYRYTDPKNDAEFASCHTLAHWLPVDLYVGGAEHAVMHLLYARFFCKALFDAGLISFNEPFSKLLNQGMILAEDGRKMSKRYGNVINPDDVVREYGADTMRMYEMFMGPLEDSKPWSTEGIRGIRRFLDKAWRVFGTTTPLSLPFEMGEVSGASLTPVLNQTIKKVTEDIESFKFNTAISQMMICLNYFSKNRDLVPKAEFSKARDLFLLILSPFAPHLSQELWAMAGKSGFIAQEKWPDFDAESVQDGKIKIAVQINGKLRGMLEVAPNEKESDVVESAKKDEKVSTHFKGVVVKHIYVPGKVINFVVR
jgi:leucyl-tRNA synthetase